MKKALALICLCLFLTGFVSTSQADEVALKALDEGKWAIFDSGGQEIGTLAKVGEGSYSILPKGWQYLGIVIGNGDLKLTGRHPVLSPSDAQLYLDALDAIKTLK